MRLPFQKIQSRTKALIMSGAMGALLCAPALAQGARPDQIFLVGSSRKDTGVITENGLSAIMVDKDGKEKRIATVKIERIIWGQVSNAYREGQAYYDRGDYENAAAKFGLAAADDDRNVIRAVARMKMGQSLLKLGATDPSHYEAALEELDSYIKNYPGSRDIPTVFALQARATLLRGNEGDAKAAGATYRKIFESGTGSAPADGYNRLGALQAGLGAMRALTTAGDTLGAREIAGVLTSEINALKAVAEEGSGQLAVLNALVSEAQLAEGFVLLAAKQSSQAEAFFKTQLASSKGKASALRFGSMLGLGQAQAAQGKHREASINFATVASIDFTDRDRSASALLHLAETMISLGDRGATANARTRLTLVAQAYGDTPSAAQARKLLETL